MSETTSVLAVIGGGRWGQVILSILVSMELPFDRVVIVSKANVVEVQNTIANLAAASPITCEILPSIDDLLAKYSVKAAIVVNAAREHFAAAKKLIDHGIHVLIEKPIVLSTCEMQTLITHAAHRSICLVPGLSYRFCSYIKNFSEEMIKKGPPKKFIFEWFDARNEIRYGQVKKHDLTINIVQDVMPHIWTILSTIFQHKTINVHSCEGEDHAAILSTSIKDIEGKVLLRRNDQKRQRSLSVQFDADWLTLDFTTEPGVIFNHSRNFSGDVSWQQKPTPLTCQLEYFFSMILNGESAQEDLQLCLHSVACTELAAILLEKAKLSQISELI